MTTELTGARKAGVGCIVSASTGGAGTEIPAYLKTLSERTGMHLLNAGAYYTKQQYPADFATKSEDEIADGLVQMATAGRLGAYGEFGVANGEAEIDPLEKKVFRSVGRAHLRTGLPIFTHNNYATGPRRAVRHGAAPARSVRGGRRQPGARGDRARVLPRRSEGGGGHRAREAGRLRRVRSGDAAAAVGERRAPDPHDHGVSRGRPDRPAAAVVRLHRPREHERRRDQRLSGPLHARDGGPGYARPIVLFVPQMRKAGIGDADIRRITQDNPRRFLAFVPRS